MSGTLINWITAHSAMKKIIFYLETVEKGFAIIMMIGIVVTTFLQVFSRYVMGSAFMWTEEIARLFCLWMVMIAIGVLLKNDDHIGMNLIPEKLQAYRRIITDLVVLAFTLLLLSSTIDHFMVSISRFAPATRLPLGFFYIVMPVGFINLALWAILALFIEVKSLVAEKRGGAKKWS